MTSVFHSYTRKACKSSCSRVLQTSRVVCCAGKPIERVVYCLNIAYVTSLDQSEGRTSSKMADFMILHLIYTFRPIRSRITDSRWRRLGHGVRFLWDRCINAGAWMGNCASDLRGLGPVLPLSLASPR